jgi:hypothetical protein
MRKWFQGGVVLLCLLAVAPVAKAGLIVEGSLGKGASLSPSPVRAQPTNIMITPGITFLSLLRAEVGFVWALPDVQPHRSEVEIRPMLTVAPPIIPLFGRLIFGFTHLVDGPRKLAVGVSGGLKFGVGPVGVFAELGVLPRSFDTTVNWVMEARAGVALEF